MSNSLSPQALLTAIVLDSAPSGDCALHRVSTAFGMPERWAMREGRSLGFSDGECYVIMRGWDRAAGRSDYFAHVIGEPGVAEGEALGASLFALAQANGLYVSATEKLLGWFVPSALCFSDGI